MRVLRQIWLRTLQAAIRKQQFGIHDLSQYSGTDSARPSNDPVAETGQMLAGSRWSAGDDQAANPAPGVRRITRRVQGISRPPKIKSSVVNLRLPTIENLRFTATERNSVAGLWIRSTSLFESVIHAAGDPPLAIADPTPKPDAEQNLNAGSATSIAAIRDGTGQCLSSRTGYSRG
jgi:hypothetical protein